MCYRKSFWYSYDYTIIAYVNNKFKIWHAYPHNWPIKIIQVHIIGKNISFDMFIEICKISTYLNNHQNSSNILILISHKYCLEKRSSIYISWEYAINSEFITFYDFLYFINSYIRYTSTNTYKTFFYTVVKYRTVLRLNEYYSMSGCLSDSDAVT